MKIKILIIIIFTHYSAHAIHIRPAQAEDIPSALKLDHRVSFEFFKPLLMEAYEHFSIPKDVGEFLEQELDLDALLFSRCVQNHGDNRLHIAIDETANMVCGLLAFHKKDTVIELDLLLVDAQYRNKGVGKKLVRSAFGAFDGINACIVYPLKYKNEPTLKFYESLGFKNLGAASADRVNHILYYYYTLDLMRVR